MSAKLLRKNVPLSKSLTFHGSIIYFANNYKYSLNLLVIILGALFATLHIHFSCIFLFIPAYWLIICHPETAEEIYATFHQKISERWPQ